MHTYNQRQPASRAALALRLCVFAPAGWLVTQAVRLRAYLNFILLASATAVDGWALPPGLLEPFPADVLLSGVRIAPIAMITSRLGLMW
jgi:hypothetical protein